MTAPSLAEAKRIVRKLLAEKLIACANILSDTVSLYAWKGEIREGKEVVIVLKTRAVNEKKVVDLVRKIHSYECPCVVFWPLGNGNEEFLSWIQESC